MTFGGPLLFSVNCLLCDCCGGILNGLWSHSFQHLNASGMDGLNFCAKALSDPLWLS